MSWNRCCARAGTKNTDPAATSMVSPPPVNRPRPDVTT